MRKWKIRTKMIAGLCGLAMVIGVLIYSSWSQLARDRDLGAEIGQLAEEIRLAHALNSQAELLQASYLQYESIRQVAAPGMIDSNRVLELEAFDESNLFPEAQEKTAGNFNRLAETLRNYTTILKQNQGSTTRKSAIAGTTELLVDRREQIESLKGIQAELQAARKNWDQTSKRDQQFNPFDLARIDLKLKLGLLVESTAIHADTIRDGMKEFKDSVRTQHHAKRNSFWLFTGLATFLITLLAWQFWTLIVVPFRTLFRGSQLIASGHRQHKILLGTNDEIGMMADTVNDITDRFNHAVAEVTLAKQRAEAEVRERTREVIQNEQLAGVGFLAAGVAHEINNPLGAIAWGAEALEETLDELSEEERGQYDQDFLNELRTNLGLIQSEAFRCKGITRRLLDFSRLSDATRDKEDIGELVSRVVSMVAKVGEYRCKTIRTHLQSNVHAHCNSQEIQQVVLNLVSNAMESVDTDGNVDIYVRNEIDPLSGTREAVVIVEDDGCGMNQEVMDHLFEPFFTRRSDGTGTGLGLSISYRIVSLHHGSLTPYSEGEGRGSKLVLRLPTQPATQEPPAALESRAVENELSSSTKWNDVQKVA